MKCDAPVLPNVPNLTFESSDETSAPIAVMVLG